LVTSSLAFSRNLMQEQSRKGKRGSDQRLNAFLASTNTSLDFLLKNIRMLSPVFLTN
jgi:hypothetical protein